METNKYFPLFTWARTKKNPTSSSAVRIENISTPRCTNETPPSSPTKPYIDRKSIYKEEHTNAVDPECSPVPQVRTQKKVKVTSQRMSFFNDASAKQNMLSAHNAYQAGNLLPNGKKATLRNCADLYGVKLATLQCRTSGKKSTTSPKNTGRPAIFSSSELQETVNHLLTMADLGYEYSEMQAMSLIRYLASIKGSKTSTKFKASHGFMAYLFIKFPELTKRKALALDYQRADALTIDTVSRFFCTLEKAYKLCKDLSGYDVRAQDVWAMDEVGFALSDGSGYKIIARKGSKRVNLFTPVDRSHITVAFSTNASGYCLQPCFILKGSSQASTFLEHYKLAGFDHPLVLGANKAYMDYTSFDEWSKDFVRNAKFIPDSYLVLIYDGHITHTMSLEALKYLHTHKIYALCIPAHSSHIFNIGDVTVFAKLKNAFRRIQTRYAEEKNSRVVFLDFPYIFKMAWDEAINQNSIIKGTKCLICLFAYFF